MRTSPACPSPTKACNVSTYTEQNMYHYGLEPRNRHVLTNLVNSMAVASMGPARAGLKQADGGRRGLE
eukprot:scaffold90082_cov36-Tisochrysis_lutea.AAC.1